MKLYRNFIGIDIGKYQFVTRAYSSMHGHTYDNSAVGIESFLKEYKELLKEGLCILETTGGYEMQVLLTLCHKKVAVHRANTLHVKNFIRSYGVQAKTDALDAKALAQYGYERSENLAVYAPATETMMMLYRLTKRREDLVKMIVSEINRSKGPLGKSLGDSYKTVLTALKEERNRITEEIKELIAKDEELKEKQAVLEQIKGIGSIVSATLLALLPELGMLERREIASLVGVAPRARDSGKYQGYRATGHGREGIKPLLFISAMAASRSESTMGDFYRQLLARGKKKKVALMALMRKIITVANAKMRDYLREKQAQQAQMQKSGA